MNHHSLPKTKILLLLVCWAIICTAVYIIAVKNELEFVIVVFLAAGLILGTLFVLVNGGIRALSDEDEQRRIRARRKYEQDEQFRESRRQKNRRKYSRFYKEEDIQEAEAAGQEETAAVKRINIFKLERQKQKFISQILLILFIPFLMIPLVDYLFSFILMPLLASFK